MSRVQPVSNPIVTVEYELPEGAQFDGVTLAPRVVTDIASPDATPRGDDQIFRPEVTGNIGLFDPDFGGDDGSIGGRFVQLLDVQLSVPSTLAIGVLSARVIPGFNSEAQALVLEPVILQRYYNDTCIFVPQGSYLGVFGDLPQSGGALLRWAVVAATDKENLARLLDQCCCLEGSGSVITCDPPEITALLSNEFQSNPAFIAPNTTTELVAVTNAPEGSSFRFVGPDPRPEVDEVTFLGLGAFQLTTLSGEITPGDEWTLEVCPPEEPNCCAILQDALLYPVCLVFTQIVGSSEFIRNTGQQNVTVLGFGFVTEDVLFVTVFMPGVVGSNINVSFDVISEDTLTIVIDTDGAMLGDYTIRISPDAESGCPFLDVPNAITVIP